MEAQLTVRRARRQDFEQVRSLLGGDAPALRAERKRFRRLLANLREELYVAERDDDATLAGLVVIAYPRGLGPRTAVVRQLRGGARAAGLLLERARARAAARGCARLELRLEPGGIASSPSFLAALARAGWEDGPRTLVCTVAPR